jgi:hypothetical protein
VQGRLTDVTVAALTEARMLALWVARALGGIQAIWFHGFLRG